MIRLGALAGLLLIVALGCAPTMTSKVIQGAVIAANVADVHSTKLALEAGRAREANPLLPDSWIHQGLIKAATTTGVIWLGTTLEIRGHRTIARVMQGAIATATAIVAAHNYHLAR